VVAVAVAVTQTQAALVVQAEEEKAEGALLIFQLRVQQIQGAVEVVTNQVIVGTHQAD
jgi:hypothetical protein